MTPLATSVLAIESVGVGAAVEIFILRVQETRLLIFRGESEALRDPVACCMLVVTASKLICVLEEVLAKRRLCKQFLFVTGSVNSFEEKKISVIFRRFCTCSRLVWQIESTAGYVASEQNLLS